MSDSTATRKKKRAVRAHFQAEGLSSPMAGLSLNGTPMTPPVGVDDKSYFPHGSPYGSPYGSPFVPPNGYDSRSIGNIPAPTGLGIPNALNTPAVNSPAFNSPFSSQLHTVNTDNLAGVQSSISSTRHWMQKEYQTLSDTNQEKRFYTFQNVTPPIAGTQYKCVDEGSASPKFVRASMYNIPESEQLRSATKLPVSITIRPFAVTDPEEDPVPVVDMSNLGRIPGVKANIGDIGPPRCNRCRAYMNPMMIHYPNGKFKCNICQFANNTCPTDYFSDIDPRTQRRSDTNIRPELHKGVYDIIVPKEYNFKDAESNAILHHVFLIDISENSIKQNLPALLADAIRATLYSGDEPYKGKIAIITYGKKLQFYNLSETLESTQITVMADLEDPFAPFYDGLFADPEASRMVIEDALNHLESLCQNYQGLADSEPCFAAACRTAMICLNKISNGGKITSVLSALPTWGPGSLQFKGNRFVGRHPPADAEKAMYNPDNEFFHLLAKDFNDNNVGLDCLVVSNASVDLSNIGWLCNATGGVVYKWSHFLPERDGRVLGARFYNSVRKCRGYQGQLKVRCSSGLQVEQYYGTSSSALHKSAVGGGPSDPIIPVVNEDQTFTVLFTYDGKLSTQLDCHFQAAMLYTDVNGIRKVRVVNLVNAVCERLEEVFNFAEEDAIVTTIVRDTLTFVGKQTFKELRDSINLKLVEVFTQYRALSEINYQKADKKHLLYPESLRSLSMYLLCFQKTYALTQNTEIPTDTRLAEVYHLLDMPIETLMYRLYPALVELHSLQDHECIENENGSLVLPEFKNLTSKSIEAGVYILCNGLNVFVYISEHSNPLLLKDLFGQNVESIHDINADADELPELNTHISIQARNLINHFQTNIVGCPTLRSAGIMIVRQGLDFGERIFQEFLVEDGPIGAKSGAPSFVDYTTFLHKAIKTKIANEKTTANVKDVQNKHGDSSLAQRLIGL